MDSRQEFMRVKAGVKSFQDSMDSSDPVKQLVGEKLRFVDEDPDGVHVQSLSDPDEEDRVHPGTLEPWVDGESWNGSAWVRDEPEPGDKFRVIALGQDDDRRGVEIGDVFTYEGAHWYTHPAKVNPLYPGSAPRFPLLLRNLERVTDEPGVPQIGEKYPGTEATSIRYAVDPNDKSPEANLLRAVFESDENASPYEADLDAIWHDVEILGERIEALEQREPRHTPLTPLDLYFTHALKWSLGHNFPKLSYAGRVTEAWKIARESYAQRDAAHGQGGDLMKVASIVRVKEGSPCYENTGDDTHPGPNSFDRSLIVVKNLDDGRVRVAGRLGVRDRIHPDYLELVLDGSKLAGTEYESMQRLLGVDQSIIPAGVRRHGTTPTGLGN